MAKGNKRGKGQAPASRPKKGKKAGSSPAAQKLSPDTRGQQQQQIPGGQWMEFRREWSYFLPPPEAMNAFDPDTRNLILSEVAEQSSHRRHLEKTVVEGDHRRANAGQWLGAGMFVSVVVAATVLGLNGEPILAGTLVGMDVTGFGGAFVYGNYRKSKQAEKKQGRM